MTEASEKNTTRTSPASRGLGWGWFTLSIAVGALALALFLAYQLIYLQPFHAQSEYARGLVADMERQVLAEVDAGIADSRLEISALGDQLSQDNQRARQVMERAVAQSLEAAAKNKPTTPRQWRLAEAAFLLRMANHWLQLEGDVPTALNALLRADEVLVAVQSEGAPDEFDLLPVRTALAKEIYALEQFKPADIQGIYLRLQTLGERLPSVRQSLSLKPAETQEVESTADGWSALINELAKFVRITDIATLVDDEQTLGSQATLDADIGPAQRVAARRRLLSAIERAQVAVLRGQEELYVTSLSQARDAATQLGSPADPTINEFVGQLDALATEPLIAPLPTISASLKVLSSVMAAR
jgi:uroporphyrin-3 C-methyltransferase